VNGRLAAVVALAAALVAVGVVLLSGGGDGGGKDTKGATRSAARKPARARRAPPRRVKGPHDSPVPILMYHVIGDPGPGQPNTSLFVSGPEFRAEMRWLAGRGYHGVTLQRAYDYWRHAVALPAKPIVISFDDGYLGQYTRGFPVLQGLHWPGVLNLKLGNVGKDGIEKSEVRKLVAAGWEIDSHTLTHPDLRIVGPDQLRTELVGSKARLRRLFGVPANFFCYPAGQFDDAVVAAVKDAGYLGATTTMPGFASPRQGMFTLDRVRIDRGDGVAGLATKLASRGAGIANAGE
jgi:peptidoglycan/xylan/chitin deacetylase (PgdA/CDA1 family)